MVITAYGGEPHISKELAALAMEKVKTLDLTLSKTSPPFASLPSSAPNGDIGFCGLGFRRHTGLDGQ